MGTSGSCDKKCIIVLAVFGTLALLAITRAFAPCIQPCHNSLRNGYHRRRATLSPVVRALDLAVLCLASNGQPTRTLTVTGTTTYSGHRRDSRAERTATFDITFDNDSSARAITSSEEDSWNDLNVRGTFVLDTATHGYMELTQSYARYSVQYTGVIDGSQQSLVVRGSWYTAAGGGDGGPFTMTVAQPLGIVDTAPPSFAAAALAVDINEADSSIEQQPAPPAYSEIELSVLKSS